MDKSSGVGVPFGDYNEEVTAGEKRFKGQVRIQGEGGAVDNISVEAHFRQAGRRAQQRRTGKDDGGTQQGHQ